MDTEKTTPILENVYILNIEKEYARKVACREELIAKGFPSEIIQPYYVIHESNYETTEEFCKDAGRDFYAFNAFLRDNKHLYAAVGHLSQSRNYCRFLQHLSAKYLPALLIQDRRRLLITYDEVLELIQGLKAIDPNYSYLTLQYNATDFEGKKEGIPTSDPRFFKGITGYACDWAQIITPNGARDILWRFQQYLSRDKDPDEPCKNVFEGFMFHETDDVDHLYTVTKQSTTWLENIQRFPSTLNVYDPEILKQDRIPVPTRPLRNADAYTKHATAVQIGIDKYPELYYLALDNWSENHQATGDHIYQNIPKDFGEKWKLYAVDMNPASIDIVQRLYPLKRIEYVCAALTDGESRVYENKANPHQQAMLSDDYEFHVAAITLRELFEGLGLKDVEVLMIDIDGFEYSVINSYDWSLKPKMIILEIHNATEFSRQELVDIIVGQGYAIDKIEPNDPNFDSIDPTNIEAYHGHSINVRFLRN